MGHDLSFHKSRFFFGQKVTRRTGFPALPGVGESSTAHRRHVACVALRQVPGILEARASVKPINRVDMGERVGNICIYNE